VRSVAKEDVMGPFVMLLAGALCGAAPAGDDKGVTVRYLRPSKDTWVLESLVTLRRDARGSVYVSITDRGQEKMTLTVRRDKEGNLVSAETVHEVGKVKKKA
jgi:hypothetical protein